MGTRVSRPRLVARRMMGTLTTGGLLAALAIAGLLVAPTAQAAATAPVARLALGTWSCSDDIATSPRTPVLLVHGTGMSAEENWSTTYAPLLAARGHAVCLVALEAYGTVDAQVAVGTVIRAITDVSRQAGRPIDVIGHSQGAYLPRAALRVAPQLARLVEDVVGLAGVYEVGSEQLVTKCEKACVAPLRQLAHGSTLLWAIGRRPLPAGPDYSNIGSSGDRSITPQPLANNQVGATSVTVQDVCGDRTMGEGTDHALIVGDAVAAALVLDALDHPGPVDQTRIAAQTCQQVWYDGFDPDLFLSHAANIGQRIAVGRTTVEPAVQCRWLPTCTDVDARGRVLGTPTWRRSGTYLVMRAPVLRAGTVRLQTPRGRSAVITALPGRTVVLKVFVGRRASPALRRTPITARAMTRPTYFTAWAKERHQLVRR